MQFPRVEVAAGGGDAGVAEQLGDDGGAGVGVLEFYGEGVPEAVRVDALVDAARPRAVSGTEHPDTLADRANLASWTGRADMPDC